MKPRETIWFILLPVAFALSFTMHNKTMAVFQAGSVMFLLGLKVGLYFLKP